MAQDPEKKRWVDMTASLNVIILAGSLLVAVAVYVVTGSNQATQARQDLERLQATMERRFDGIDTKIAGLPTQTERLAQLIQQHADDIARLGRVETRIGDLEKAQERSSTQIDGILRPTSPPQVRFTK